MLLRYTDYGAPFKVGDVVGCYLNFEDKTMGFSVNGVWLGFAYRFSLSEYEYCLHCAVFSFLSGA